MRKIKSIIKLIIVKLIRLIKHNNISSKYHFQIFESRYRHTFFGYYDIIPFSRDNSKVLAMATDHDQPITCAKKARVGFFDMHQPYKFREFGETTTWCWQQGCRLAWHPKDPERFVRYNKLVDNDYGCVIQDIITGKIIREHNFPYYDLNSDASLALSLNFSRLQRLRPGYGYCDFKDVTEKDLNPAYDGIWLCDMSKNNKKLIVTLDMLSKHHHEETMENAEHYINHLCFNPSGNRFLFFHLWLKNGKRYNRAITSDLKGNNLNILSNNNEFVSHYRWKNDEELLIYSSINRIPGYYLYNDKTNDIHQLGKNRLKSDGHPDFFKNNEYILTDTYPSRFARAQSLILYSISNDQLVTVANIYSPENYNGEVRCDLHPRKSNNEEYICIDSPFQNGRKLIIFDKILRQ